MISRSSCLFSDAGDGDLRNDLDARAAAAGRSGIAADWATVVQVHGTTVIEAVEAGVLGEADAIFTTTPRLPIAVFTADCAGVVLESATAMGVAHAGWRGVRARVVERLLDHMGLQGHAVERAWLGPMIGSCCFEVGDEVAEAFPTHLAATTWGSQSVDLGAALVEQLGSIPVEAVSGCTMHEPRWYSHRRDGAPSRMATVAWLRS